MTTTSDPPERNRSRSRNARLSVLVVFAAVTAAGVVAARYWLTPKNEMRAPGTFRPWNKRSSAVACIRFSPDGAKVATAGADGLLFWDVGSQRAIGAIEGRDASAFDIAFAPDAEFIASCGPSGVKLWDVKTARLIRCLDTREADRIAFSPSGKTLAVAADAPDPNTQVVELCDLNTGNHTRVLSEKYGLLKGVAFSTEGALVVAGSVTGRLWVWTIQGAKLSLLPGTSSREGLSCLALSPDSKWVATGGPDDMVRRFDIGTGKEIARYSEVKGYIHAIAVSPDGKLLAAAASRRLDAPGTVEIWETESGRRRGRLVQRAEAVECIAFSPDGKTIVAGGLGGTVMWSNVPENLHVRQRPQTK